MLDFIFGITKRDCFSKLSIYYFDAYGITKYFCKQCSTGGGVTWLTSRFRIDCIIPTLQKAINAESLGQSNNTPTGKTVGGFIKMVLLSQFEN